MATKQRFSITSLLLVVALVAALIVIWLDRSELARAKEDLAKRNYELGFIDAEAFAPDEGAIRHVPTEGTDMWQYRIYLPDDNSYQVEYLVGHADDPKHYSIDPLRCSWQFSIVIHRAIDLYKPNFQPRECFVTSIIDESNKTQSRFGEVWNPDDTKPFRSDMGHYSNVAGPNHREMNTFKVGESVDLFRSAYSSKIPEGETLRIRLVHKPTGKN